MGGESEWHVGHEMGGYQNPACPECQREDRHFRKALALKRRQATEQGFSDEFIAGYLSAIDEALALLDSAK